MKNLNSFKAIARAIDGERARQIELLEEGRKVIQETRRWDDLPALFQQLNLAGALAVDRTGNRLDRKSVV